MKKLPLHDQQVWNDFRAGDRAAFARIFEQHYRTLYAYGRQFLHDPTLTEDAIQELFITLWRTRENLAEVDNIKFYLFRSLRRVIRRLSARENRFQPLDFANPSHRVGLRIEPPTFALSSGDTLLTRRLKSIIADLPQRQREVVTLRYYENFDIEEIALIMCITEKTVRNTLFNAMTTLRGHSSLLNACLGALLLLFLLF